MDSPGVLAFGDNYTWPNGDTVTVGVPVPVKERTASPEYRRVLRVEVAVTNAGPEAKQANSYVLRGMEDGQPVDELLVPGLQPATGFVAPGGKQKWSTAYQVRSATPVEFEVQVFGEMYDPARPVVFFRGSV